MIVIPASDPFSLIAHRPYTRNISRRVVECGLRGCIYLHGGDYVAEAIEFFGGGDAQIQPGRMAMNIHSCGQCLICEGMAAYL